MLEITSASRQVQHLDRMWGLTAGDKRFYRKKMSSHSQQLGWAWQNKNNEMQKKNKQITYKSRKQWQWRVLMARHYKPLSLWSLFALDAQRDGVSIDRFHFHFTLTHLLKRQILPISVLCIWEQRDVGNKVLAVVLLYAFTVHTAYNSQNWSFCCISVSLYLNKTVLVLQYFTEYWMSVQDFGPQPPISR